MFGVQERGIIMRREDLERPVQEMKSYQSYRPYYYRDGYVFAGGGENCVYNTLIIRYPSYADIPRTSQLFGEPRREFEENLKLIQDLQGPSGVKGKNQFQLLMIL